LLSEPENAERHQAHDAHQNPRTDCHHGGPLLASPWIKARAGACSTSEVIATANTSSLKLTGRWVERWIISAQELFAFGTILSVFDTHRSLGFIVLVQLIYVFAPRLDPFGQRQQNAEERCISDLTVD
jgi:hypothetical protein